MNKLKKAFTLVELIVVITILAILWTIAFISLQWYSKNARDSTVISDISLITTSLELFNVDSWKYPEPDGPTFQVTQSTAIIFTQGFIWDGVTSNLWRLNKKPLHPLTNKEYIYSKTMYGNVYEIGSELEIWEWISMLDSTYAANRDDLYNYIKWTYNWVTAFTQTWWIKYVLALPSIITNTGVTMPYIDTFNKLLISWLTKSEWLEYTPKVVWSGGDFPKDTTELETMMNNIIIAYTWTKVSDKGLISTILENKDDISFFNIWKDLINTSMWWKLELPAIVSRNCNLDWWLSKQDWVNWVWWDCYREYCHAWFIESWINDCTWTGDLNLQADTFISEKEPNFSVRNTWWTNVFYQLGPKALLNWGLIPVDTTKTYKLSWDFRSTWISPNRMYFWLESYDENKKIINAVRNLRIWNSATLTSYDSSKITTDTTLVWWYWLGSQYYQTAIGFYYDWVTNKLPDDIMLRYRNYSTDPYIWAYSKTSWTEILLNREIPDKIASKIIPWVTKVMDHYSWWTYIYTYSNSNTPTDWFTTLWDLTWEAFWISKISFRVGTKYIRVVILANWPDLWNGYQLEFNNIHFEKLN
jgi:prepilin-type N-terminal cleavage/methylation domain-containing protein